MDTMWCDGNGSSAVYGLCFPYSLIVALFSCLFNNAYLPIILSFLCFVILFVLVTL